MKTISINEVDLKERIAASRQEKEMKGKYGTNDFALVRTTDYLPENHILLPLSQIPFLTHTNNISSSVISKIFQKKYHLNPFDDEDYEKLRKLVVQYSPLSSQYRSTIHFTLNGLVSSHSKGDFDNRNFIIIDKLAPHLGKEDFKTIRMEDTFIQGQFKISNEAIILINKEKYENLIKEHPWLSTYQIIIYSGNSKSAVESVLLDLGITPENIEEHGAEYTKRTPLYKSALNDIATTYGCSEEKHFYSKEYKDDDEKTLKIWNIFNKDFYEKLCSTFHIESKEETINFLSSYNFDRRKQEEQLRILINQIGLEEYCEFVLSYNKALKDKVFVNKFPTNDELLNHGKINTVSIPNQEKTYQ